jgi:hypothetical protein
MREYSLIYGDDPRGSATSSNCHSDPYAYRDANTNANSHLDSNTNTNSNTNIDRHPNHSDS